MVYVFKKINNLTGDTPAPTDSSAIVTSSSDNSSPASANPHQSTYQNPSNIYNANLGENLGKLDTGLTKNINDTQQQLGQSMDTYKNSLNSINSNYNYGGQSDLQNIGDTATFSRLNSMVNPLTEQNQLNAVQSNTGNYNPDTQGLASASTIPGLSSQLQNQYGTTAGGSRLDAQLYRGSGQAGKAINDNLAQLNQFQQNKNAALQGEQGLLGQYNTDATNRAGQIQTQGNAYQQDLLKQATDTANSTQNQFNKERQQGLQQLQQQLANTNYQQQLQNSIISALGFSPAISQSLYSANLNSGASTTPSPYQNVPDQYRGAAESIYNSILPQIDLSQVDPNQFVTQNQTFTPEGFLDPRYNLLGKLLGTDQRSITPENSTVNVDSDRYGQALQNYLLPQLSAAKQAAMSVLNQGNMTADPGNKYVNTIQNLIRSPAFTAQMPGGGLGFSPTGKPIAASIQDNLAQGAGSIGDTVVQNFNPGGWF